MMDSTDMVSEYVAMINEKHEKIWVVPENENRGMKERNIKALPKAMQLLLEIKEIVGRMENLVCNEITDNHLW